MVVLLFLAVVARLVQRIVAASRIRRRTLTPVLAVAVAGILVTAFGLVVRRFAPGASALTVTRWLAAFALPAMALAFLVGLVRWRLYVAASLGRFAASIGSSAGPGGVRDAFADAFEDPTLEIVYPVGEDRWAAADGRPVDAPVADSGRSVTDLRDANGNVVAALVHDQALEAEAAFINVIGSYASLSLENQRLAVDVANLVREMRDTRARAAASADDAREQIERDLHDGAQQRLIALRIKLQLAAERSGDTALTPLSSSTSWEPRCSWRSTSSGRLPRRVFPTVLVVFGPVPALKQAARAAPIPTTVTGVEPSPLAGRGREARSTSAALRLCRTPTNTPTPRPPRMSGSPREVANSPSRSPTTALGFDVGTVAPGAGCTTCTTGSPP